MSSCPDCGATPGTSHEDACDLLRLRWQEKKFEAQLAAFNESANIAQRRQMGLEAKVAAYKMESEQDRAELDGANARCRLLEKDALRLDHLQRVFRGKVMISSADSESLVTFHSQGDDLRAAIDAWGLSLWQNRNKPGE